MNIAKGTKSWIFTSLFFAFIFLVLFIIFWIFNLEIISSVFLIISALLFLLNLFFLAFFRDPDRKIGNGIVACADGKIREIKNLDEKDIGKCIMISTFMNIHNVHVNRMPLDGKIIDVKSFSGLHLPAFKKESEKNERVVLNIQTRIGKIKIILIAGTVARRIVTYIKKDETIKKGEKIGIIRLGSRVDVYLPLKSVKKIYVKVGNRVKAGVDKIAEIND